MTENPQPEDDPRKGVTIPAGASTLEAAAAMASWLHDNANTAKERAQFVIELDDLLTDFDFTLACVKGLAPGLPDSSVPR
jgi:hypothetical protein